jgi:hypothetical protein
LKGKLQLVLAGTVIFGSESRETHHILFSDGCGSLQTTGSLIETHRLPAKILLAFAGTVILSSKFYGTYDHILLSDWLSEPSELSLRE